MEVLNSLKGRPSLIATARLQVDDSIITTGREAALVIADLRKAFEFNTEKYLIIIFSY